MTQDSGFNGHWQGVVGTPDRNEYVVRYTFLSDGTTLSGTTESNTGTADISGGAVYGNEFAFHVDVGGVEILHSGTLSGDTIQMSIDYQGMKYASTLTRSAPTPSAEVTALGEP